ncbi:MAG: hypothetical protein ACOYJF_04300 [Prevotella sp.]|jgi:nitrate/nitrite transporter NarK
MRDAIDHIARHYQKYSLWLTTALALLALLGMSIVRDTRLLTAVLVSVVFSLMVCGIHGAWWRSVARRSPDRLGKFYLMSSVARMMVGLLTYLILVLCSRVSGTVLGATVIFVVFYIAILVFDCIYFARVEKKNKVNE